MRKLLCLFCSLILLVLLFPHVSALSEEGNSVVIKEEDGGEFRSLPIDLEGGSPLPFQYFDTYNSHKYEYYEDPTIRVERYKVNRAPEWGFTYWYAMITIRDPSQLRTAAANENNPFLDSMKVPCVTMAKRKKAVLAINGDYCASFSGIKATSYILRQGTVYRETVSPNLDILLIDEDGLFHVLTPEETDLDAADKTQIDGKQILNAFQFGPALVRNGEPVPDDIVLDPDRSPAYSQPEKRAQRMCICQIDEYHYMAVCCANWGATLTELRDLTMSLAPVKTVYTLDGGMSSQMVFLGHYYNEYANGNKESRNLTDIIYFASAWFTE